MSARRGCLQTLFLGIHSAAIFLGLIAALLRVQEILFISKNAGILNCVADKIFQVRRSACMGGSGVQACDVT